MPLKNTSSLRQAKASDHPLPKYKRYHFLPTDDRQLLAATSFEELRCAIRAVAQETNYPLRIVSRRAKKLGIWNQFASPRRQFTIREKTEVKRLLRRCHPKAELLSEVAATLRVSQETALRLLYRDPLLKESLTEDTYTLREVAQGLCLRPKTVKQWIDEGLLRAKQLRPLGRILIPSDAISDFVTQYPRRISWDRCLQKSLWLKDILETARVKELAALLCVAEKTVRSWMQRGYLILSFHQNRIADFFGDEPVYQFLDEHSDLIDLTKCSAQSPDWFARYKKVQGQYPRKKDVREGDADLLPHHYLALRKH
jgi:hypothetical protein